MNLSRFRSFRSCWSRWCWRARSRCWSSPALEPPALRCRGCALRLRLAGARLGGRSRSARCGARRRRRGGSRSRRCAAWCCCDAGRWALRLSAACAALPLLFAPRACPSPARRASASSTPAAARRRSWSRIHMRCCSTPGDSWNTRGRRAAADRPAGARRARARRRRSAGASDAQCRSRAGRRVAGVRARAARGAGRRRLAWHFAAGRSLARIRQFRWDGVRVPVPSRRVRGGRYCVLRVSAGAHVDLASRRSRRGRRTRAGLAPAARARSRATWCS